MVNDMKPQKLAVDDYVRIPKNVRPFSGRIGKIVEIDEKSWSTPVYVVDFENEDIDLQEYDFSDLSVKDKVRQA